MSSSAEKLVKYTIKLISKSYDLDYEEVKTISKKVIKSARNYDDQLLGMMEEMLDLGNIGSEEELEEFELDTDDDDGESDIDSEISESEIIPAEPEPEPVPEPKPKKKKSKETVINV